MFLCQVNSLGDRAYNIRDRLNMKVDRAYNIRDRLN